MKKYIAVLSVLLLMTGFVHAQTTDLARIEYTYFPQDQSENLFARFRTFVNVPIKLSEDGYFIPGFEYRNINLKLRDQLPFPTNNERFQSFTPSIAYTDKMKNDWRYAAKVGVKIASDFEGDATSDDYIYEGAVYFIKDKKGPDEENPSMKPWRLVLGLSYSTTAGRPFPLPIINYYREFHPDWSFSVGTPKSNIKYRVNDKSAFQAFVTLDGFFANIRENVNVAPTGVGENISMTTVLSGLGYEYEFVDHLLFYVYFGHTIINDIRLRDGNGDDVYTINDQNNFYGRSGIKVKI